MIIKLKQVYIKFIPLLLFLLGAALLPAQTIKSMEFRDQPIVDILMALAQVSEYSIVPDNTVSGNASYYFSEVELETALDHFLSAYKLYHWKEGSTIYVSRVRADFKKGKISLDAEDVDILSIIRAASKVMGKTILYDNLPSLKLTIHADALAPDKFMELLVQRLSGNYELKKDDAFYYLNRIESSSGRDSRDSRSRGKSIKKQGALFSLSSKKERFRDLIAQLFQQADKEYILIGRNDKVIEELELENKSFETLLGLLMDLGDSQYQEQEGIYYIFDVSPNEVLKKVYSFQRLSFQHLNVEEVLSILPSEFLSRAQYKIDKNSNSIILFSGDKTHEKWSRLLKQLDRPVKQKKYARFDLQFYQVDKIKSALPESFQKNQLILLKEENAFIMPLTESQQQELSEYLEVIDKPKASFPVYLEYIQTEDLIKTLPPNISKEQIIPSQNANLFFFQGTEKQKKHFLQDLALIDLPVPQLRYDILIINYSESSKLNFSTSASIAPIAADTVNNITGTLGYLLKMNFDIISTFGLQFAGELETSLAKSKGHIMADTTLRALAGQEVHFQNTSTSRYHELDVEEDGSPLRTGVTREVSTGIILKITGKVSGKNMISMDISATISDKSSGSGSSDQTSTLPETSEKVVNTHIRTFSGKPIIISGLKQLQDNYSRDTVPLLGQIPLLGKLFGKTEKEKRLTEYAVFLVPHLEHPERESNKRLKIKQLYQSLAAGN